MLETYVFRSHQKLFLLKVVLLYSFFQLLLLLFIENMCLDDNVCKCCGILINLCIMKIRFLTIYFFSFIIFLIKTKNGRLEL